MEGPHRIDPAPAALRPQAAWARFHEFGRQRALCLLHRLSITSVLPSGEVQETPLLQPCTAIWPLTEGLLLVVRRALRCRRGGVRACRPQCYAWCCSC